MNKIFICFSIAGLFSNALGHGKEQEPPKLSPNVLEKLQKIKVPKGLPATPSTSVTCLQGFVLHENMCVKVLHEPARPVCHGVIQQNGSCQIQVPPVAQCTNGYAQDKNECSKIVETGFQFYCPKGFYDDGAFCAKSVAGEVRTQCPIGVLEGNRCVLRERKPHLIKSKCPDGTILENHVCWKEIETFDCSTPVENTVTVLAAPQEQVQLGKKVLVSKGKTHALRSLSGKEELILPPLPPPQPPLIMGHGKEMVAVQAPHPEKIDVISQVCSKKVQVDALALVQCPIGYIDSGSICVKEIITPPLTLCTEGHEKDGTCQPTIRRVPKQAGCPKNSWLARGKCWKKELLGTSLACPNGFVLSDGKCIGSIPVTMECPLGYEIVGATNMCMGKLVRPPFSFTVEAGVEGASKKY